MSPGETGSERRTFQIHSCLGRGGFGEVYRATMESSGGVASEVAVKVLRSDINPGSDSVKRLRDEGRLLGQLSHPSIVKVHDLVVLDGRVSLVTEFVEGEDLDQCFKGSERMSARALVTVIGEVASALAAAWDSPSPTSGEPLRLIHRDVKPANIRIGRHGEVKLLDFGIARAGNAVREAQTAANAMMGSYLYMAPERFHEDIVQPPSDIFALGSVLYEGLSGERFFGGMSLQQVYAFMLSPKRYERRLEERLAELALDVEEGVLQLLREMMAADPVDRPTAPEVSHRCEDLAEEMGGTALKRWARRRSWENQDPIHGSLDGRVLTAGTVGTERPPPRRTSRGTPRATSGRIPNAPPTPAGEYSPPPPAPQALGSLPVVGELGLHDEPTDVRGEPRLPSQPPTNVGAHGSLNEPGLGDFSAARNDIGRDGPMLAFGTPDDVTETLDHREQKKGGRGVWGMLLAVGLVGLILLGLGSVGAFFVLNDPTLVGMAPAVEEDVPIPVEAVPEDDPESAEEPTEDEGADEPADEAPEDGETGDEGGDAAADEPEPEPEPEAPPEPAPAPAGPTASSLTQRGWSLTSSDMAAANQVFQEAIALDGSYGEAHYGYGYSLVKLGEIDAGKVALCRAKGLVGSDTANEIDGILQQNDLTCD